MIALAHAPVFTDLDAPQNVAKRPRLIHSTDNSFPFSSPDDSAIIIKQRGSPSRKPQIPRTTYPQPSMLKCTEEIDDVSQCRLKRIQSRDGVNVADVSTTTAPMRAHVSLPLVHPTSEIHSPTCSDSAPGPEPGLQNPAESDVSADSDTDLDTDTDSDTVPRYPFPPPGLSKQSAQTMIISELEANACAPGEYELKCTIENPVPQGHHDSSIWSSFQIESFLGNYCSGGSGNNAVTGGGGGGSAAAADVKTLSSSFGLKSGGGGGNFPALRWSLQEVPQRNCNQPIPSGPDPFASDSDSDYDYCDYDLEYSSSRLDTDADSCPLLSPPSSISLSPPPIFTLDPDLLRQYHHIHQQQQQQLPCGGDLIPPSSPSPSLTSPQPSTPPPPPIPNYPLVTPVPRHPARSGGAGGDSGLTSLIDPQLLLRQRQKAYVTGWSQLRERRKRIGVGPAPVMPSLMNPMRAAAPTGAWTLLREVLCADNNADAVKNAGMVWRRGKPSTFEKPLSMGMGRSRIFCDRVRKDQQDAFGLRWGLHAWLGPTKHCRHCASDGLLKGLLAYRAYEGERVRRLMKEAEMMTQSVLDVDGQGGHGYEEGTVFLSYPYVCQLQNPFIEAAGAGVTQENADDGLPDCVGRASSGVQSWSEEMEKELLESPMIKDLDDFDEDGEGGYYEDEYGEESDEDEVSSEECSSESSEEDEEGEVGDNVIQEKEKEVLKSFWEEDDEEWREEKLEVKGFEGVQEVQVAEVQVVPEVQVQA